MAPLYLPIHPMVLRIETIVPFDVYRQTSSGGYDLFYNGGTEYSHILHSTIFGDSISELYIQEHDLLKYLDYIEKNYTILFDDPFIETESKAKIIHEILTHVSRKMLVNINAESVVHFKNIVIALTSFVSSNPDAIKHLISLTKKDYSIYNHLINVGIYGIGLTKEIFPKKLNGSLPEIASGLFLHDIGRYNIPKNIEEKNGPLTEDEWTIVKKHPKIGYNILKKMNLLTEETQTIILQHHERHDGKGYPLGLKGDQIHTYGKICSIADAFDALTSHRPYRQAQSSFKALDTMLIEMKNEFDRYFFSKFVLLFSKQKLFDTSKAQKK